MSISGKDEVNCDRAEEIDASIRHEMDNKPFGSFRIKRSRTIKPLISLINIKKGENYIKCGF